MHHSLLTYLSSCVWMFNRLWWWGAMLMRLRNVLTFCFLCCGSNANSCRGSQRVFVASALVCVYIHNLHVCERTWPVPPPPCWGCSVSWLQVLLWDHFLPTPCCVRIHGLQLFPVRREEETIGNRMSIQGGKGHKELGEVEEGGDDPGNSGEDLR